MQVLKYLLAFLVLSVVIFIHEFGHYIIAKASGVKVEEFSLGMGPRLLKFTKNGTMYSLKLFFFGGSCRMKGEDEDDDSEGSFQSATWGRRFAILFAGPFFNFVLAFVLAVVLFGVAGYDPCVIYNVKHNSAAEAAGLMAGDHITKINSTHVNFYGDYALYTQYEYNGREVTLQYIRDGKKYSTTYLPTHVTEPRYTMGVYLNADEPVINSLVDKSPAVEAGILAGDRILKIDDFDIATTDDISPAVNASSGSPINVLIDRAGEQITITMTPIMTEQDYFDFGFSISAARVIGSPIETIGYAFKEVGYWIKSVFFSFKMMFAGKVSVNDMSGVVGIVSTMGEYVEEAAQDGGFYVLLNLLNWCILISANLGVMNLLPIPALDGGRILFLLIELVIRKPVPRDKEAFVNVVGFILLMVLMVIIMFNDIRKLIIGI